MFQPKIDSYLQLNSKHSNVSKLYFIKGSKFWKQICEFMYKPSMLECKFWNIFWDLKSHNSVTAQCKVTKVWM